MFARVFSVDRSRRIAVSMVVGLLLSLVMAAPASAAPLGTTIVASYGYCNFSGGGAGNKLTVGIEWRNADGDLKSLHSVKSKASGSWKSKCDPTEFLEGGDTVKTTVGTKSRTFTMPYLTLSVDRVTNVVSGYGPASSTVSLEIDAYFGGFGAPTFFTAPTVATDGNGFYSRDFSGDVDVKGWDDAWVYIVNGRGDIFARTTSAPAVRVWVGRSEVDVVTNPGGDFTASLVDGANAPKADVQGTGDYFGYSVNSFPDTDPHGNTRILVGDGISSDVASDLDFDVPTISGIANVSQDKVTVTCPANVGFSVRAYAPDQSRSGSAIGTTSGAGSAVANLHAQMDVRSGDKLDVHCKLSSGDVIARHTTIP